MPASDWRIPPSRLRVVRSLDAAVQLLADLGYRQPAAPVDVRALALPGLDTARVIREGRQRRAGYGVVIGEAAALGRSLRPLARAVQREVHDQPLGVVGVGDGAAGWSRLVIFRPRRVSGPVGTVTVARLDVDLAHPTGHDAEVISALRWRPDLSDAAAQAQVSEALNVEAVTGRFYRGLQPHFAALERAVQVQGTRDVASAEAIREAGGSRRVAIRILTQILFCYFLQRKQLLGGDRDYLSRAYANRPGLFYPTVLEPLFYDTLAVPVTARVSAALTAALPFLNGGLFERRYGDVSLNLPDPLFDLDEGLLGYLNHWTFTVAEETADETEVAVDPEMLGRIFESLLPDAEREQKGTYYTPRPVVQFMCREALVTRLAREADLPEAILRSWVSADDTAQLEPEDRPLEQRAHWARRLDDILETLTILDPAVGSGAFLLGMLGEIVRLRGLVHRLLNGQPASELQVHGWKLQAIERGLFGVDIEPTAIELCRLRLWLSLIVEQAAGAPVAPLPNLEYRVLCANSLVDFVEGIALQDTRRAHGRPGALFAGIAGEQTAALRAAYFAAADPTAKEAVRTQLLTVETELLDAWLSEAKTELARRPGAQARIAELRARLRSPDRVYPIFLPGFSAPEVWGAGGWDIVIMNPPYVGRKEIPQRFDPGTVAALEQHFGQTQDLMILFGRRALELLGPRGVLAMIFNDSIFTSTDGDEFRRTLFEQTTVTTLARTKCFEGQAVNGGIVIARVGRDAAHTVRWVEGYRRPVEDFAAASAAMPEAVHPPAVTAAGALELFFAPSAVYETLPHRPLYRPSAPAVQLRDRYTAVADWQAFGAWGPTGWPMLSNTSALERTIAARRKSGFYDRLAPGDWVLLGLVTEGGQGLATADDRRFLGAIAGTDAADDHERRQAEFERRVVHSPYSTEYQSLQRQYGSREDTLLALWAAYGGKRPCPLPWPRTGIFRVVPADRARRTALSEAERRDGIAGPCCWVPFEKGDQSQEVAGADGRSSRIGAAWARENPLVIDWSREAVTVLRRRASAKGAQSPRLQNEALWFHAGVTWNSLARYLRARLVPEQSIFGHMAPLVRPRPWLDWLSPSALLALLNSDVLDFLLRTFLGSLMHIEIGDVRRLVVPVLGPDEKATLETLAGRAVAAKRDADQGQPAGPLGTVEADLNAYVRRLYGVPGDADLWVVR